MSEYHMLISANNEIRRLKSELEAAKQRIAELKRDINPKSWEGLYHTSWQSWYQERQKYYDEAKQKDQRIAELEQLAEDRNALVQRYQEACGLLPNLVRAEHIKQERDELRKFIGEIEDYAHEAGHDKLLEGCRKALNKDDEYSPDAKKMIKKGGE